MAASFTGLFCDRAAHCLTQVGMTVRTALIWNYKSDMDMENQTGNVWRIQIYTLFTLMKCLTCLTSNFQECGSCSSCFARMNGSKCPLEKLWTIGIESVQQEIKEYIKKKGNCGALALQRSGTCTPVRFCPVPFPFLSLYVCYQLSNEGKMSFNSFEKGIGTAWHLAQT